MKYLILVLLFLPTLSFANSLDKRMVELNKHFNPIKSNDLGYELDYKNDGTYVWVNIIHVKKECKNKEVYFVYKNSVWSQLEYKCENRFADLKESNILQVYCQKNNLNKCINAIAEKLTVEIVKQIIDNKIDQTEAK